MSGPYGGSRRPLRDERPRLAREDWAGVVMVACAQKRGYGSRLEAESVLAGVLQKRRGRSEASERYRAAHPADPTHVYRCPVCDRWHLTSKPLAGVRHVMAAAHGSLVAAVIAYIGARGGLAWKTQSGRLPVSGRFVHTGKRGLPDVIGVWPDKWCPGQLDCAIWDHKLHRVGRLIAVEVKVGKDKLKAHQEAMHAELRKRGALVIVARDITDVQRALTTGPTA